MLGELRRRIRILPNKEFIYTSYVLVLNSEIYEAVTGQVCRKRYRDARNVRQFDTETCR